MKLLTLLAASLLAVALPATAEDAQNAQNAQSPQSAQSAQSEVEMQVERMVREAAAKSAIKDFATQLQARLKSAMAEGGPVNAIEVCNHDAPEIARSISEGRRYDVARTSLKLRNPANAPDAWERQILESFEARKAAGAPITTLEKSAFVEIDGKPHFRFMKAIPTMPLCVSCHGKDIAPAVDATLDTLYPEDQARGFAPGDIRGAFTVTMEIK